MHFLKSTAIALASASYATSSPLEARQAAPVDQLVGYGAGATGGGSKAATTVTTCAALTAAAKVGGVIKISGTLSGCGVIRLVSDTSLLGVGANSGTAGTGFLVRDVSNIVIRNLKLGSPIAKTDLLSFDNATTVWIDHNDISSKGLTGGKDDFDGLLDASHGSDKITVSWNKFHDHWKGSLVGHSDKNVAEDKGKLHVTYHHNSFINVNSRLPSIRFGTGHIYSNCYQNNPTSGVNSREGAQVLVEQNYFQDTPLSVATDLDAKIPGFAVEKNNIFTGTSSTAITQVGSLSAPYAYTLDPAASVCSFVASKGGVGVVTF